MKHLLPKKRRISQRSEIRSLLHTARRWRSKDLSIIFRENELKQDRMAVLVSRRHGNAVARNRLKRKVREVFRRWENSAPPYYDILIRPHYQSSRDYAILSIQFEEWSKTISQGNAEKKLISDPNDANK